VLGRGQRSDGVLQVDDLQVVGLVRRLVPPQQCAVLPLQIRECATCRVQLRTQGGRHVVGLQRIDLLQQRVSLVTRGVKLLLRLQFQLVVAPLQQHELLCWHDPAASGCWQRRG
jgi:hypothetical protein